jgi:hypothetical protein
MTNTKPQNFSIITKYLIKDGCKSLKKFENLSSNSDANFWIFLQFPRFQLRNPSERGQTRIIYITIISELTASFTRRSLTCWNAENMIWCETKVSKWYLQFYVIFRTKTKLCWSDSFENNRGVSTKSSSIYHQNSMFHQ